MADRKTAEQIMKKKAVIRSEIERKMPKAQADALWRQATEKLAAILARYADLPEGLRPHTDARIFPSAAIYLTARERLGQQAAYAVIEDAAVELTGRYAKKLAGLMRVPGMPSLFIRIWDPLTRRAFGPNNGFKNGFYPKEKGAFRMDILACPYFRYFTELGCPELTKVFCENDDRMYSNLPGIVFERTGTLGKGAQRCDFCIRKA